MWRWCRGPRWPPPLDRRSGLCAHQAMLEERARRAEEGREHEARRRVQQERLRIAREMHDAVRHQVALISVQADAMGYLDSPPVRLLDAA